jgi:3-phytase
MITPVAGLGEMITLIHPQLIRSLALIVFLAFLGAGCYGDASDNDGGQSKESPPTAELQVEPVPVTAAVETESARGEGDIADDPAIWVHPEDEGSSLVIGANKDESTGGLHVYGLDGKERQYLAVGEMNNVDLRYGVKFGKGSIDLVGATNRNSDTIDFFKVTASTGRLETVGSVPTDMGVYGFCMYQSPSSGTTYAVANSRRGEVEQYLIEANDGEVTGARVRSFEVGNTTEGCVADDELGHLYVGEEERGVWRYGAEPDTGSSRTLVDESGSGRIQADIEGLTIYHDDGGGYLIVSSQGSDTFAVYERVGDNRFIGSFKIVEDEDSVDDDVSGTDGIDVTSASLDPSFRRGLFVAHDNFNSDGTASNFKLIDWAQIAQALDL